MLTGYSRKRIDITISNPSATGRPLSVSADRDGWLLPPQVASKILPMA
jgi:hypothetical protein